VELAADAGAKRLVLFHHEPEHDDDALDALQAAAQRSAQRRGAPVEVIAAQEGMQLSL
jgi:phosphoribosyl 1,2-cyclic phosphodiesterase